MKHQAAPIAAGVRPQNTTNRLNTSVPELSAEPPAAAHPTPRASSATPITCIRNTPAPIPSSQPIRATKPIPTAANTSVARRISP